VTDSLHPPPSPAPTPCDDDGRPLAPAFAPDAWELLSPRLTDQRRARLERAAAGRTRHIRLVVQDLHDPHNVSACMRSAEALGVQDVDVVTLKEPFRVSTVARGVADWLTIRRHRDIPSAVAALRASGYLIVAGVPRTDAVSLYDLPLDRPIAVVFGNEHAGISPEWLAHVDQPFTIPMVGLVESLNISVSAAITLSHLTYASRVALPRERYYLSDAARSELLSRWICRQIPSWEGELARARCASAP
jgi:tRNA (guanosine-2'-O-)-methyltransferase